MQMFVHLIWSQRSLRLSSVLFILFALFCSSEVISNIFSSSSLIHSSASDILLSIPSRAYFGEGNGIPLQYSCLENPMDGGAWLAKVHGFAKNWTWLSDFTFTFTFKHTGSCVIKQENRQKSNLTDYVYIPVFIIYMQRCIKTKKIKM